MIATFENFNLLKKNKLIPFMTKGSINFYKIISSDRQNSGCEWVIHLINNTDEMDVTFEICGDKSIRITDYKKYGYRTKAKPELTKTGISLMKKYIGI